MNKTCGNVLVTGGAGFIGSHLVDRLLGEGFEVTVIDNFSKGYMENISSYIGRKDFHLVKGDIRDFNLIRATIKGIDAVFHEAAFVSVVLSIEDPILVNDVNLTSTLNLLKASVDSNVKRFVFASSAAVYGETKSPLMDEAMVPAPTSPYGVAKLAAETYARAFYKTYGLETVALRYFNVYGPRQSFDIQSGYGGVITLFLNKLLRNIEPLIYGDGEQTRDFVYVQDVVEANMLALNTKNAAGEYFNIGSSSKTTVNQVAQTLKTLLNRKDIKNLYSEPRPGEVKHGYADISKARKLLDYNPRFSFEQGITDLVTWYTTQLDSNCIKDLRS
jgi:nucleoside-diphosphate-sugar epimerase